MFHIEVDASTCQHYGQCALEAPDVFQLTDSETLEWKATAESSERADVERAADVCPTQAISVRN